MIRRTFLKLIGLGVAGLAAAGSVVKPGSRWPFITILPSGKEFHNLQDALNEAVPGDKVYFHFEPEPVRYAFMHNKKTLLNTNK